MKIGYLEFLKAALNNNRIAVSKKPTFQALFTFNKFVNQVVPTLQQKVQVDFLRGHLEHLPTELEREEVIQAYLRRQVRLKTYAPPYKPQYRTVKLEQRPPDFQPMDPVIAVPVQNIAIQHVDKYVYFLKEEFQKYFKAGCFGYYNQLTSRVTRHSIMVRHQALAIIEALKLLKQCDLSMDPREIFKDMESKQIEEYINDEFNYPKLFYRMAFQLKKITDKEIGEEHYLRLFGNSTIQDTIINELLSHAPITKDPFKHLQEFVRKVKETVPMPSACQFNYEYTLSDGLKVSFKVQQNKIQQRARMYQGGPSFKNIFLSGDSGNGKSMILNYLALWAHKSDFIVLKVREAEEWTQSIVKGAQGRKLKNGLFLQSGFGRQWLESFIKANQQKLSSLQFQGEIGRVDYSGRYENEYEPVPNIYYKERKTYFNDPDKLIDEKTFRVMFEEQRIMYHKSLKELLPKPSTLLELCQFGVNNQKYSINIIGELLLQLKAQTKHPVLFLVDDFNFFYRRTRYRNYKYQNQRLLDGCIPPNHLALCRLFMNLNGHQFNRGVKIVAGSPGHLFKHVFKLQHMFIPNNFGTQISFLNKYQTSIAVNDFIVTKLFARNQKYADRKDQLHLLSQGNWRVLTQHLIDEIVVA